MKRIVIGCLALTALFLMTRNSIGAPVAVTDTTLFMEDRTVEEAELLSFGGDRVNELQHVLDRVGWTHHLEFLPSASEMPFVLRFDGAEASEKKGVKSRTSPLPFPAPWGRSQGEGVSPRKTEKPRHLPADCLHGRSTPPQGDCKTRRRR